MLHHQSTSLLAENQDCGVESRGCHEGACSAAPVAQNEKSLNSAIAYKTQGQVEAGNPALLLVENSVSGVEIKADHEGEGSAALVPDPEKWSHSWLYCSLIAFVLNWWSFNIYVCVCFYPRIISRLQLLLNCIQFVTKLIQCAFL
ncbi:hypothetical protein ACEYW6_25400 [Nostoc sp. UIC 10607]|uniref:hypothetical protein n=1 Tax=Nostoc sp. UIC 10607 TaxID=3045935 RepID=UPI0039A30CC9